MDDDPEPLSPCLNLLFAQSPLIGAHCLGFEGDNLSYFHFNSQRISVELERVFESLSCSLSSTATAQLWVF